MADGHFKDLTRRTAPDIVLREKGFNIAKIQNMMDVNVDMLQWFINFLIKILQMVPLHLQINLLLKIEICQTTN